MTEEIQRLGDDLRKAVTAQTIAQDEANAASELSKAKRDVLFRSQQSVMKAHSALQQAVRQHFLPTPAPPQPPDVGDDVPGGGANP